MKPFPQLAYLIPVLDDQEGLDVSLASLGGCPGPRPTVVVVDDGSAPPLQVSSTPDMCVESIRLVENQGIAKALNVGLDVIMKREFKYMARLDAGDEVHPERNLLQMEYLEAHPDVAVVGSHALVTDPQGRGIYPETPPAAEQSLRRAMHLRNVMPHASIMLRCDVLRDVGVYSDAYPAAEDYELLMRIMQRHRAAVVGGVLVKLKFHPQGITQSRRRDALLSRLRIQWMYFKWRYPESYVGILRSLAALAVPASVNEFRKRLSFRGDPTQ